MAPRCGEPLALGQPGAVPGGRVHQVDLRKGRQDLAHVALVERDPLGVIVGTIRFEYCRSLGRFVVDSAASFVSLLIHRRPGALSRAVPSGSGSAEGAVGWQISRDGLLRCTLPVASTDP